MHNLMILALIIALPMCAQQNKINFEVHAVGFPKNCILNLEMKLSHQVVDYQRMRTEGRKTPLKKDFLMEQNSVEKHSWKISFDDDGRAVFDGSSQAVSFSFSKPISELSNAIGVIRTAGSLEVAVGGKKGDGSVPMPRFSRVSEPSKTYVLFIKNHSRDGKIEVSQLFLTKEELPNALAGKPIKNHQIGIPIPPR
ncbi:MAG: hypothetical protein FWG02_05420 [Holophagaceae bacterium]|nr:hypothetical protein [Holophagaceae bacterium]